MIQQALQYLKEQMAENSAVKIHKLPGTTRKVLIDQAGKYIGYDIPPADRKHTVNSVLDLIEAAKRWNTSPVVWLNDSGATLVIDDADRRDLVLLNLVESEAFTYLKNLQPMPQPVFVRALRISLGGMAQRDTILAQVRKLKWKKLVEGTSTVDSNREVGSSDQDVEVQTTDGSKLPDFVTIAAPVFGNPGEFENVVQVGFDLEVQIEKKLFALTPLADELKAAKAAALQNIRDRIVAALPNVPVLFGSLG